MNYVNINGQLTQNQEAKIHISDLGLRRGYGAFEFFRVLRGIPVFIEDHLARLENSAQLIELVVPYSQAQLEHFIHELIQVNGLERAGIQMVLTGGYSEDAFTPSEPNLIIAPISVKPQPESHYTQGSKIILYQNLRELAQAKTTAYVTAVKLSKRVKAEGATEVVYHDGNYVTEGGRSSLCIIKNGTLITAKDGVLPGITRMHMLGLAQQLLRVEYRAFTLEELFSADEVILTGATREVMPVTRIEDKLVAGGQVGSYTKTLMKAFREHVEAYLQQKAQEVSS
ncbi:MAG: aminotransferase class IV family protein [Thermaceae bacterium]|nr:aminotransferase class IV family protein [Thermaceae bacterium]